MANYLFETMSDQDALAYDGSTDHLFFLNGGPADIDVTYNAAAGLSNASVTLSESGVTHTFVADALAGNALTFFGDAGDDTLAFGHDSTGEAATVSGVSDAGARYFALGGADSVTGSAANDTIYGGEGNDTIHGVSDTTSTDSHGVTHWTESDYLNGGAGDDSITGGEGNDHIYGNDLSTVAGTDDGNDHLFGGNGNDYIQGNAGDDGISGDNGNDKLYGGAGDDSILGGDGNDWLQGNKGADHLDGGNGTDVLHGGADNDVLFGGDGNDQLFGDAGNDTLGGGTGIDTLTGGDGKDVFDFSSATDISNLGTAATAAHHDALTTVTDFTHGTDTIDLGSAITGDVATLTTNFASIDEAYGAAQTYIAAHHTDVDALQVGTDTVLFWSSTGGATIDSAVVLHGVTASTLDNDDFGLS